MDIKNKIVAFDQITGSIVVNYYCDEIPEGLSYSIDVPIENGQLATQDVIDQLLILNQPTVQLERLVAMKTAEIPAFLAEKIPAPIVYDETNLPADNGV